MYPVSGPPTLLDRQALALLQGHGFRCTPVRIATLGLLLAHAPGHATVKQIHQRLVERGWPTSTTAVHRALQAFTNAGLTHTLAIITTTSLAYCLATPPHHHVLCTTCGAQTAVPARMLAATLAAAHAATGYQLTPSGLSLPGRCPACQQHSTPPSAVPTS